MHFWLFMSIMTLLIPLSMLGFGRYFLRGGPRRINSLFGYRTPMAMENKDTWEFAHLYAGKIWVRMGSALFVISLGVMFPLRGQSTETIAWLGGLFCTVQCIPLLAVIPLTERELRKVFDRDGNRIAE